MQGTKTSVNVVRSNTVNSTSRANNNSYDAVTLENWIKQYHSEEDMREVFLNMDRAMKYVHDYNYCVKSFHPADIEILNSELDQIRFKALLEMPNDPNAKRQYIKEDIYNSSFLQIGIYTKCLYYLRRDYLKDNFESFATFVPQGDVPYYRGVVERGASVYFCEYDLEKRKRDLATLEQEVGGVDMSADKSALSTVDINEEINSVIYRQITKRGEAAYINFLVYPTMMLAIGIIVAIIVRILSLS